SISVTVSPKQAGRDILPQILSDQGLQLLPPGFHNIPGIKSPKDLRIILSFKFPQRMPCELSCPRIAALVKVANSISPLPSNYFLKGFVIFCREPFPKLHRSPHPSNFHFPSASPISFDIRRGSWRYNPSLSSQQPIAVSKLNDSRRVCGVELREFKKQVVIRPVNWRMFATTRFTNQGCSAIQRPAMLATRSVERGKQSSPLG